MDYNHSFIKLVNILQKHKVWESFKEEYMRYHGIKTILPEHVEGMNDCSIERIMQVKRISFDWDDSIYGCSFWSSVFNDVKNSQ